MPGHFNRVEAQASLQGQKLEELKVLQDSESHAMLKVLQDSESHAMSFQLSWLTLAAYGHPVMQKKPTRIDA